MNFLSGGSVKVELQDADGKTIPSYAGAACDVITGDSVAYLVTWKGKEIQ